MRGHICGSVTVGLFLAMSLLVSTAVPSYAWSGGHGGGGGGNWASHGGGHWGGSHGGNWHGGWGGGHWHGHHFHGSTFFVGVGGPFWWYPYGYYDPWWPYAYPAYYPPVAVESSPQTYIQQDTGAQQYWYYCQSPEGYYPYVKECPGGWQPVAPQPPSSPQ